MYILDLKKSINNRFFDERYWTYRLIARPYARVAIIDGKHVHDDSSLSKRGAFSTFCLMHNVATGY